MTTLSQVTKMSRHVLVISALVIGGIFLLVILINFIKALFPTPPAPPTVAFGKLPAIAFPKNPVSAPSFQFNLDTLSGSLPSFGDRVTIHKIPQSQPTLFALDNTTTLVGKMGYVGNPRKVSDSNYVWINSDDLPKTILINIFTNNFAISSPYQSNKDVLQGNNLPDQNNAITTVTSFLQNASLLPTDIDTSKTKTTLLKMSNGQLISASSLSETQIIQVDLFQNDVNKLPLFYPQPTHSTMSLFVGGGSNLPQVVLANFNHQSIGSENATYPIKTAQEAFADLKKGDGYIASYDGTGTNISIHNVVLGYYMSDQAQPYLMPIVVFEGDHGFFAYISALKEQWISN